MTTLNRFPSRIRFVNQDGTLTREALLMLDALVARVGGSLGDVGDDIFALQPTGDSGAASAPDVVAPVAADAGAAAAPEVAAPTTLPGHVAPVDLQPISQGAFIEMTFQGSSR